MLNFKERFVPELSEMLEKCDHQYGATDFCKMEQKMFDLMDFDVNLPIAYFYTRRFSTVLSFDLKEVPD